MMTQGKILRVALLATAAFGVQRAMAQPGPGGPPAVGVVTVKQQAVTQTDQFVGRIQAINRVDLVARVTGFLEKQLFVEGPGGRPGQVLYHFQKPASAADPHTKAATVAQANAQLQNASITLGRASALLNTPAGQRSTVDDATASQRSNAALLMAAQAQLRTSQINLGYTDIAAPIAGKISQTNITVGNVVGPTTGTLATIVGQDPMYIIFPIAVSASIELRDRYADKGGASAVVIKLKLPSGKIYDQDGHIDYVGPSVSATTDTLTIRGKIANPVRDGMLQGAAGDRELTDGEFVTVLLRGAEPIQALAIPQAAVLSDQTGSYVYVVGEGNKADIRRITLGQPVGAMATVSVGLKQGETVISDGLQRVHPGQPVNPAPSAPGPGGAGGPPGGAAPAGKAG